MAKGATATAAPPAGAAVRSGGVARVFPLTRRALIAREIPFDEISADTRYVMRRWLTGAMTRKDATAILAAATAG